MTASDALPRETVLEEMVMQHAQEAGFLWTQRDAATRAFDYQLGELSALDDRLDANLDGLRSAGPSGKRACELALAAARPGDLFAPTVLAIENEDPDAAADLLALAEAVPDMQSGLFAAFAWVSPQFLRGAIAPMLASASAFRRRLAIACCAFHRVHPGRALTPALEDADSLLRARALRTAGEIGASNLVEVLVRNVRDGQAECAFWACWSAVLLGEREEALDRLSEFCLAAGPHRARALQVALPALGLRRSHELLRRLAGHAQEIPMLIFAAGISGDTHYVPWLIAQMADPAQARLAGEAFSMVTGVDLLAQRLAIIPHPPAVGLPFISGATGEQHLPVPDAVKVQAWWTGQKHRFAERVPLLEGSPATLDQCRRVLEHGKQQRRIAASLRVALLEPGGQLFEWRAPAGRQRRRLRSAALSS